MQFYLAPMEGITGYIYRNAYRDFFGDIDKYFTPFIAATSHKGLKSRELRDVLPENNEGIEVVPQILTNNATDFITTVDKLKQFGYKEVNLNLGCPSGTVVSKFRGSGFLAKREMLDEFLAEIFDRCDIKISLKTRLGKDSPDEFYELINIFNKYPMEELIIHPRVQKDYYKNTPNMAVFADAMKLSTNRVCYNGNIFKKDDYDKLVSDYKELDRVMIGRGIIGNPKLVNDIKTGNYTLDKDTLRSFHDRVFGDYYELLQDQRSVVFKMKEMWFYMGAMFEDADKYLKKIRKANTRGDYEAAVNQIFRELTLNPANGFYFG